MIQKNRVALLTSWYLVTEKMVFLQQALSVISLVRQSSVLAINAEAVV